MAQMGTRRHYRRVTKIVIDGVSNMGLLCESSKHKAVMVRDPHLRSTVLCGERKDNNKMGNGRKYCIYLSISGGKVPVYRAIDSALVFAGGDGSEAASLKSKQMSRKNVRQQTLLLSLSLTLSLYLSV